MKFLSKDLEIIVVDNYSSDETEKLLGKYSKNIIFKKKSKISKYPSVNQIDLLEEAFKVSNGDGINFKPYVWHFPLISIEDAKFITIDKKNAKKRWG